MFKNQLAQFWPLLNDTALESHSGDLQTVTNTVIERINQGDLARWLDAYNQLPECKANWVKGEAAVTAQIIGSGIKQEVKQANEDIEASMRGLHPWRKGPFQVGGTYIDAEWRSNLKWQRLIKGLPELRNRTILDVGCGNGYYMFRMAEHDPRLLIGIEPGLLQNVQFWAVEQYVQSKACILPLKVQDLPSTLSGFDVVFSMGILYHRKSPVRHLEQLKSLLAKEGTLVLETLIVDGDEQTCLVPSSRYAQMRNVWFLPSTKMLCLWLKKVGFRKVEVIDESLTTTAEQRTTEWMQFHSLKEFLADDEQKTIEGYSPPKRVVISCQL